MVQNAKNAFIFKQTQIALSLISDSLLLKYIIGLYKFYTGSKIVREYKILQYISHCIP